MDTLTMTRQTARLREGRVRMRAASLPGRATSRTRRHRGPAPSRAMRLLHAAGFAASRSRRPAMKSSFRSNNNYKVMPTRYTAHGLLHTLIHTHRAHNRPTNMLFDDYTSTLRRNACIYLLCSAIVFSPPALYFYPHVPYLLIHSLFSLRAFF